MAAPGRGHHLWDISIYTSIELAKVRFNFGFARICAKLTEKVCELYRHPLRSSSLPRQAVRAPPAAKHLRRQSTAACFLHHTGIDLGKPGVLPHVLVY